MALLLLLLGTALSLGFRQSVGDCQGSTNPNNVIYAGIRRSPEFHDSVNRVFDYLRDHIPPGNDSRAAYTYGNDSITAASGDICCYNKTTQQGCILCLTSARDNIRNNAPATAASVSFDVRQTQFSCILRYQSNSSSDDASQPSQSRTSHKGAVVGIVVGCVVLVAGVSFAVYFFLRRSKEHTAEQPVPSYLDDLEGRFSAYSFADLQDATSNFSSKNKLGQGGFGAVYEGVLKDGSKVAIKKLSMSSPQGKDVFVNEVNIISSIRHRNLVKLKGYCAEAHHRLLVLELLENGSLDSKLFGKEHALCWEERLKIAIGVARGLAYIHEESRVQIIHRDIKASNILLDEKMEPKISDFGVSKLFDQNKGHTSSTRVAGTYGYLAPEYALYGRLTTKVDVFSYGVLLLEIVSGQRCSSEEELSLLEQVWKLYREGEMNMIIDRRLSKSDREKVFVSLYVALACTQPDAESRPMMSEVVAMLLGYLGLPLLP